MFRIVAAEADVPSAPEDRKWALWGAVAVIRTGWLMWPVAVLVNETSPPPEPLPSPVIFRIVVADVDVPSAPEFWTVTPPLPVALMMTGWPICPVEVLANETSPPPAPLPSPVICRIVAAEADVPSAP